MPGKQVLQSTFDAIVREAMSDFGMNAAEAVADAREQLAKAGVTDFSNLVDPTESGGQEHERYASELLAELRNALESPAPAKELTAVLSKFKTADETVVAVAGANGVADLLLRALCDVVDWAKRGCWDATEYVCSAVVRACENNEANRSRFVAPGVHDGVSALKALLELLYGSPCSDGHTGSRVTHVLQAISVLQRRCEPVKQRVASGKTLEILLHLLTQVTGRLEQDQSHADLFKLLCSIFRQLLAPDDPTVAVAETFNRARILTGGGTISESGLRPLSGAQTLPSELHRALKLAQDSMAMPDLTRTTVFGECITLARLCAVSDEACADLFKMQFHELAISILDQKPDVLWLTRACLNFLRNMAQKEECKSTLFQGMDTVRMVTETHLEVSPAVVEYFAAFVASLCLRRADIALKCVSSGLLDVLIRAMELHKARASVQKIACLAIRNASSRNPVARQKLREGGSAEAAVRKAWKAFPKECDEVAYNALRDLDVLRDEELRRDERYTMPAGFFDIKPSRITETGGALNDT